MTRFALPIAILVATNCAVATKADEPTREAAIKVFKDAFLGTWGTAENPLKITLSEDGASFIIQSKVNSRLMGWDPANKCLRLVQFSSDGGFSFSLWKQVDDKPSFDLEVTSFNEAGEKTTFLGKVTFPRADFWKFTIDGDPENREWAYERLK